MKAKALFGKSRREVTQISSLLYNDAPAFYQTLATIVLKSCLLLHFLILTVAFTRKARWALFEKFDGDIWTQKAACTKPNPDPPRLIQPFYYLNVAAFKGVGSRILDKKAKTDHQMRAFPRAIAAIFKKSLRIGVCRR